MLRVFLSGLQLSFESSSRLLWFCFLTLSNCLKTIVILNQSEVKPKPIKTCSHAFSAFDACFEL